MCSTAYDYVIAVYSIIFRCWVGQRCIADGKSRLERFLYRFLMAEKDDGDVSVSDLRSLTNGSKEIPSVGHEESTSFTDEASCKLVHFNPTAVEREEDEEDGGQQEQTKLVLALVNAATQQKIFLFSTLIIIIIIILFGFSFLFANLFSLLRQ